MPLTDIRRWWSLILAGIIGVLLANAVYSIRVVRELKAREEWVKHTYSVLRELGLLSESATALLVEMRRALLDPGSTDEPHARISAAYHEAYDSANRIRQLVADNTDQQRHILHAQRYIDELHQHAQRSREVDSHTLETVREQIRTADVVLDRLQESLRDMRREEVHLLDQRQAQSRATYRKTVRAQLISTVIAIMGAATTYYISNRRHADLLSAAMEQSKLNEQNRLLIESTNEGICGIDHQGTCMLINKAAATILGYETTELLGTNLHAKVHHTRADGTPYPEDECPIRRAILAHTRARVNDEVFWRRDGRPVPVEYASAPILEHNRVVGAVITFSDITSRRLAEQQLLEAKGAAEKANHAKSQFLARMSHELRTPLNAVIMYSEMLQEESADLNIPHFSQDLQRIHTAGRHLLSLVNGVLDIAKIEAGKMELHVEDFEIGPTINDVVDTIRSLMDKRENQLIVQQDVAGTMRQDVTKFRQILLNLLSNAAKFTEKGTVTLTLQDLVGDSQLHDWVEIAVTDTGMGIAEEKLGDLFRPFVQLNGGTANDAGGTGLGLVICKQFCELMGGTISVTSRVGKGTRFTVRLPRQAPSQANISAAVDPAAPPARGSIDVLIIDDDPNVHDFVSRALAADDLRSASAYRGEDGLQMAQRLHPRLIVLDILMPSMDGWAVLTRLKTNPHTSDIPVVLLTLLDQPELGYTLGAQEYLQKPVSREQLTAVAQRLGIKGRPTALVVDDDANTRDLLTRLLEREEWTIHTAENGRRALEWLDRHPLHPDIILLDLQMPEMDGFDFIFELRARASHTSVPIVVLTSRDLTLDERQWLSERVRDILQKGGTPYQMLLDSLRRATREMKQGRSLVGDEVPVKE